jgi:hypothetical protein
MTETSAERYKRAKAAHLAEIKKATNWRLHTALCALPGLVIGGFIAVSLPLVGIVVAVLGAAVGAGIYLAIQQSKAGNAAKSDVMTAWAGEHGWQYQPTVAQPSDIAFCRNRQKPVCEDGFAGPMAGLAGLVFNFTYSTYETRTRTVSDGNGTRTETYTEEVKHHHTILRLDLGALGIHRLQLAPQSLGGAMLEKLGSAFSDMRSVDLESAEFNKKFTLRVDDGADDLFVRRVFEPAMIVRCVEGAFPMATFQYEDGALAFVWGDPYDVKQLEEVEQRVTSVGPITEALTAAHARLAPELKNPS